MANGSSKTPTTVYCTVHEAYLLFRANKFPLSPDSVPTLSKDSLAPSVLFKAVDALLKYTDVLIFEILISLIS
jgi:hypothetical protein